MTSDLIVLVADKDMEHTIQGLLTRTQSLLIRKITFDIFTHIERDPGCYMQAHSFLRSYSKQYDHALVLFDHEGSGQESKQPVDLQEDLESRLAQNGWQDNRAKVIIIQPELEIWVWSDSPEVDHCLGWAGQQPDLRSWLRKQGYLGKKALKPANPKLAVEQALRYVKKPRSAAIYGELAQKVSVVRCQDPSFLRLKSILQNWFPRS